MIKGNKPRAQISDRRRQAEVVAREDVFPNGSDRARVKVLRISDRARVSPVIVRKAKVLLTRSCKGEVTRCGNASRTWSPSTIARVRAVILTSEQSPANNQYVHV